MSQMKKVKKVDVRKVLPIGKELVIDRVNAKDLRNVYYIYLKDKNIKLTYEDKDLIKVIDELENKIYESVPRWEEKAKKIIKKDRREQLAGYTISSLIILGLFNSYINLFVHEVVNAENSKYILENYANDVDNDGIKEIYTDSLESYNDYYEPTILDYYKYTNPFYYIAKDDKISDNVSMRQAMYEENIEVIKIDDEIYSTTGYVSFFTFERDNSKYLMTMPYQFESKEEALEIIAYKLDQYEAEYSNLDYIATVNVKNVDEIPSVYKNKEDGSVTTKKANKILTKVIQLNKPQD